MKTLSIIKYFFTILGIAMLLAAFLIHSRVNSFLSEAVRVDGTMVEYVKFRSKESTTYRPVVQFNAQNGEKIEFTSSTGSGSRQYATGTTVEIFYLPSNPENAKINSFFSLWGASTIVGFVGATFFSIGAGIFGFHALKKRKIEYLQKFGTSIEATYQGVERNTSYKENGRSPYRLFAQWKNPNTSELHIFYSENLWFDPSDHIDREKISVLVDLNNLKSYQVDTAFLPKIAK